MLQIIRVAYAREIIALVSSDRVLILYSCCDLKWSYHLAFCDSDLLPDAMACLLLVLGADAMRS